MTDRGPPGRGPISRRRRRLRARLAELRDALARGRRLGRAGPRGDPPVGDRLLETALPVEQIRVLGGAFAQAFGQVELLEELDGRRERPLRRFLVAEEQARARHQVPAGGFGVPLVVLDGHLDGLVEILNSPVWLTASEVQLALS